MATPDQPCNCNEVAQNPLLSGSDKVKKCTIDLTLDPRVHRYHPRLSAYHLTSCVCTHCLKVIADGEGTRMWHNGRDQRALQIIDNLLDEEYYSTDPGLMLFGACLFISILLLAAGSLAISALVSLQSFEESPVELIPSNSTTVTLPPHMVGISPKGLAVRNFYESFNACEVKVMGQAGLTQQTHPNMFDFASLIMAFIIIIIVVCFMIVVLNLLYITRTRYKVNADHPPNWLPCWLSQVIYGGVKKDVASKLRAATAAGQDLAQIIYLLELDNVRLRNMVLLSDSK